MINPQVWINVPTAHQVQHQLACAPMDEPDDLIDVKTAAALYGTGTGAVRRLYRTGIIRHWKNNQIRGAVRVSRAEVLREVRNRDQFFPRSVAVPA